MSKADQQFVTMCRDILDHGTTTEGQKVRPVWEDGTPAYTIMPRVTLTRWTACCTTLSTRRTAAAL